MEFSIINKGLEAIKNSIDIVQALFGKSQKKTNKRLDEMVVQLNEVERIIVFQNDKIKDFQLENLRYKADITERVKNLENNKN